jgi:glycosyltransferase involved in cell wall biosynthesis
MPTKTTPTISVIIPCYNEERNLERRVLDEVYEYLAQQDYAWEVIIVNDESTDNSKNLIQHSIATKENFTLFDVPHGGKPAAIWAGLQKAQGQMVLTTDMDQSTPMSELGKLLPWSERGFDVVIGSRGTAREGFSLVRRAGSFVFGTLRGLVLLRSIADTQCGFKLYRRQVVSRFFPRLEAIKQRGKPTGWKVTAFDIELLYLIEKAGYRIKEVVVSWSNRDQSNTKSQRGDLVRYVNESLDMAQQVMRVKLNQLRGFYNDIAPPGKSG